MGAARLDTKQDPPQAKAKSWSAIMKSKYLGKSRSVLVMRDSDVKNLQTKYADYIQDPDGDVSIEDLVASVQAKKAAPGQEEIYKAIDKAVQARLPKTGLDARRRIISSEEFSGLVETLVTSFNANQLNSYHVVYATDNLVNFGRRPSAKPYEWKPRRQDVSTVSRTKTAKGKGKKKEAKVRETAAQAILREIWGIKVHEEMVMLGQLELDLTGKDFLLKLWQRRSAVIEGISRDLNVIITGKGNSKKDDTQLRHRVVVVQGSQEAAEQAAERLLSIGQDLVVGELRWKSFRPRSPWPREALKDLVRNAAEFSDCVCTSMLKGMKLLAPNAAALSKCYRAIYAAAEISGSVQQTWIAQSSGARSSEHDLYPSDVQRGFWFERPIAHMRTPVPLFKGGYLLSKDIPESLLQQDQWDQISTWLKMEKGPGRLIARFGHLGLHTRLEQLSGLTRPEAANADNDSDRHAGSSKEQADEGLLTRESAVERESIKGGSVASPAVSHSIQGNHPEGAAEGSDAVESVAGEDAIAEEALDPDRIASGPSQSVRDGGLKSRPPTFQPSNVGIPNVIMDHARHQDPTSSVIVRVELVPNPFMGNTKPTQRPSRFCATFGADAETKTLHFQRLTRTVEEKQANIQLPELAGDLRVDALDEVEVAYVTEPDSIAAEGGFQSLVESIEQSGRGFATITPPSFVDMHPSLWGQASVDEEAASEKYFVSNIEFLEHLSFDLDGLEMTFTRSTSGDIKGQTDHLELHMGEVGTSEAGTPLTREDFNAYFSAIQKIIGSINRTNRGREFLEEAKPREPSVADRQYAEQLSARLFEDGASPPPSP